MPALRVVKLPVVREKSNSFGVFLVIALPMGDLEDSS
jgi:hypothetical protein